MRFAPCAAVRVARLARPAAVALTLGFAACGAGYLGDPPTGSPGTVTLRLLLNAPQTFCDQVQPCAGVSHVAVRISDGQWLRTEAGWCATQCTDECPPPDCPAVACAGPGIGVELSEIAHTWNGAYLESSRCGETVPCHIPRFVPPGRYVARMCATPGVLSTSSVGQPTCSSSGLSTCVDVPFDLPGPSPVMAYLPSGI